MTWESLGDDSSSSQSEPEDDDAQDARQKTLLAGALKGERCLSLIVPLETDIMAEAQKHTPRFLFRGFSENSEGGTTGLNTTSKNHAARLFEATHPGPGWRRQKPTRHG